MVGRVARWMAMGNSIFSLELGSMATNERAILAAYEGGSGSGSGSESSSLAHKRRFTGDIGRRVLGGDGAIDLLGLAGSFFELDMELSLFSETRLRSPLIFAIKSAASLLYAIDENLPFVPSVLSLLVDARSMAA